MVIDFPQVYHRPRSGACTCIVCMRMYLCVWVFTTPHRMLVPVSWHDHDRHHDYIRIYTCIQQHVR